MVMTKNKCACAGALSVSKKNKKSNSVIRDVCTKSFSTFVAKYEYLKQSRLATKSSCPMVEGAATSTSGQPLFCRSPRWRQRFSVRLTALTLK